jgi:hypothetical protein
MARVMAATERVVGLERLDVLLEGSKRGGLVELPKA